jgi:hypothetical protein
MVLGVLCEKYSLLRIIFWDRLCWRRVHSTQHPAQHSTAHRFLFWLRRWITHSEGSGAYLRALTRWRYGIAQRRALEWSIYTHTFIRHTLRGALLSVRYTLGGLTLYSIGRFALGIVHNSIRRGCVDNK